MDNFAKPLWLAHKGIRYNGDPWGAHSQMWNEAGPHERDKARREVEDVLAKHTDAVLKALSR